MIDRSQFNKAAKQAARGGIEALPDGKYEFEVTRCEVKEVGQNLIYLREAVVLGGDFDGHKVAWDTFIQSKGEVRDRAVKDVTKDLETLGFPADAWLDDEVWLDMVIASAAAVVGRRFKGTKKENESGGKKYQNLYVNERLATDGKPARFADEDLKQANREAIPF